MKIYMEFYLASWLYMAKFTELNISDFLFLNFDMCKNLLIGQI